MGAQNGVRAAQSVARVGPGWGAGKARGGSGLAPATTSNAACAPARANPEGRSDLRHPAALPAPCVAPATPRHPRLARHRNSLRRGPRSAPRGLLDWRLMASVLLGFVGVALILRPTLDQQQLWHGLAGLVSGILAAMAYLQVTALGRAGEPELRVVFYFSVGGAIAGALITAVTERGLQTHTPWGGALLLAVGLLATTAQVCLTRAYAIGRPLVNACLQYLGIVFSFGFGMLLFQDPLTWAATVGMLLIIGAGLIATMLRANVAPPPKDSQFNPNEV
ncbi:MAG: DMT family transporter [Roseateles sp.]